MEIAAAILAGGATFFAGFCLGLFPPIKQKSAVRSDAFSVEQNKLYQNFLNYNGEIQP